MELIQAIPVISAREQLDAFGISDYPYLKKPKKDKLVAALKRQANPSIMEEQAEELDPLQLVKLLNR